MITDRSTYNEVMEFVCENLPEDWILRQDWSEGEAGLDLIDPHGCPVEFCDDDMTTAQMIISRVNHARNSDGLQSVDSYTGVYQGDEGGST